MDKNTPEAIQKRRIEELQALEQKIQEFRQTAQTDLQRQQQNKEQLLDRHGGLAFLRECLDLKNEETPVNNPVRCRGRIGLGRVQMGPVGIRLLRKILLAPTPYRI